MDEDILRQRRNLITISTILILFDFADVKIAKVGVLGTDLIVGSPTVLVGFAWVIWAYFLLRYYQYWRSSNGSPNTQAYYSSLRRYALNYSRSQSFQRQHGQLNHVELKISSPWKFQLFKSEYQQKAGGSVEIFSTPVPLSRTLAWKVKACFHTAVHTPHFTDHILPFTLALAAPLITLATHFRPWLFGAAA